MMTDPVRWVTICAALLCAGPLGIGTLGCGSKTPSSDQTVAGSVDTPSPAEATTPTQGGQQSPAPDSVPAGVAANGRQLADTDKGRVGLPAVPKTDPEKAPPVPTEGLHLRADLSSSRLAEFLKLADLEMQRIANQVNEGGMPQVEGDREMVRLGKLKLQAAMQLQSAEDADPKQRVLGVRGQLQSLSHLAALGDLKSVEQLEALAKEHVDHEDLTVAEDSRLVLIGLALERIQNGSAKGADEVMAQVEKLGEDGRTPNIAAMMVLGQARAVLAKYGFTDESSVVRNRIVDLFASHPDPNVASMAWEIAGTPRFAEVDRMLRSLERDEELTLDTWRTTIAGLLADTPDLSAVQFIAGAALHAEAAGREDLASVTYELLESAPSLGERERQEVQVASAARQARQAIIGQAIDLDLPSADGRPLSMTSYRDKVVLMPFWSIDYPESLSLLQLLDEIRDQSSGKVEIVGVNLDVADAPFDEFMAKSPVRFRSFHSETNPTAEPANAVATQFGVVSMPFVVVVDRDGTVADIDFTGQRLRETVADLLASPAAQ